MRNDPNENGLTTAEMIGMCAMYAIIVLMILALMGAAVSIENKLDHIIEHSGFPPSPPPQPSLAAHRPE